MGSYTPGQKVLNAIGLAHFTGIESAKLGRSWHSHLQRKMGRGGQCKGTQAESRDAGWPVDTNGCPGLALLRLPGGEVSKSGEAETDGVWAGWWRGAGQARTSAACVPAKEDLGGGGPCAGRTLEGPGFLCSALGTSPPTFPTALVPAGSLHPRSQLALPDP